jgi:hypothetical protein
LETHFEPKIERDWVRNPREKLRLVASRMDQPLNLETSHCRRHLTDDHCLMELVVLDGFRSDISEEDLQHFIETFPVETEGELT